MATGIKTGTVFGEQGPLCQKVISIKPELHHTIIEQVGVIVRHSDIAICAVEPNTSVSVTV